MYIVYDKEKIVIITNSHDIQNGRDSFKYCKLQIR